MKLLVRVGSVFLMVLLAGCASQGGGGGAASLRPAIPVEAPGCNLPALG